jgi:hypothetical protein
MGEGEGPALARREVPDPEHAEPRVADRGVHVEEAVALRPTRQASVQRELDRLPSRLETARRFGAIDAERPCRGADEHLCAVGVESEPERPGGSEDTTAVLAPQSGPGG